MNSYNKLENTFKILQLYLSVTAGMHKTDGHILNKICEVSVWHL